MDAHWSGRPARGILGKRTWQSGVRNLISTRRHWETREVDERTSIELFQIWVNLPASQKFDPPSIRYLGAAHGTPWNETTVGRDAWIRTVLVENIVAAAPTARARRPTSGRAPRSCTHIPAGGAGPKGRCRLVVFALL